MPKNCQQNSQGQNLDLHSEGHRSRGQDHKNLASRHLDDYITDNATITMGVMQWYHSIYVISGKKRKKPEDKDYMVWKLTFLKMNTAKIKAM